MPPDVLMPAFALTLLANAVLVAAAIRALRRGRSGQAADGSSTPQPSPEQQRADIATSRMSGRPPEPSTPAGQMSAESPGMAPTGGVPATPGELVEPEGAAAAVASEAPGATTGEARSVAKAAVSPRRPTPSRTTRTGRPRVGFSLPPLDEDHEKVSRSIQSFLSSGDPEPILATVDPGADSLAGATTVAIVAVDGLGPERAPWEAGRRRRRPPPATGLVPPDKASPPAASDDQAVLALLERTIRGTARGTDVVSADERGRFRIILAGTGELAARAYLRRIRATVEPALETADRPLSLRIATATVLGGSIGQAAELAERRLAAGPWSRHERDGEDDGDPGREPAAAVD